MVLVVSLFLNQAQVYTHHFKYFVLVKYTILPNILYPFIIYHSYPNMLIYDDLESVNHHSLLVTQKLGACHNQAPPAPALRIDFLCQALDFALKTFACGLFPDRQSKNGTIQWKRSGDVSIHNDTQWYTMIHIFNHIYTSTITRAIQPCFFPPYWLIYNYIIYIKPMQSD